jgi:hypothetical protein
MDDAAEYWFSEGTYAFKAGIPLTDLVRHYPERDMHPNEWKALERGWVAQRIRTLEESGQARLF